MSKTIIFKPEFEKKLKKLKIKTKFIKRWLADDPPTRFESLQSSKNWRDFILTAFIWKETIEGEKYWNKISQS
jgi:hypothetical protein